MSQLQSDFDTEMTSSRYDAYYNHRGINQPAMLCAIGVIMLGLLVFMTAALLPLGLLIMIVGGVWALVILALGRRTPEGNHRL